MTGTRQRGRSVVIPVRTEGAPQAQRDFERLGQSGDRALRQITLQAGLAQRAMSLLGPVLAGLSVAGLAAFARNAVSAAGAIGEVAEQIGITTDALQVLQFASVQSGVSAEELERALATLTRTIADAEQGSGDAAARFERFGIAFRDAGGNVRATEAILGDVADAMSRLESPTERAALATAVFGDRLGQRMIPALVGGRSALEEFERQARASGQVLDEDTVRAARRAADNIAALQRTGEVFARNLALTVVPAIDAAGQALNRWLFGISSAERGLEIGRQVVALGQQIAAAEEQLTRPLPGGTAGPLRARLERLRTEQAALIAESERLARDYEERQARLAAGGGTFEDRPTGRDASFLPLPAPATPDAPTAGRGGAARPSVDAAAIRERLINEALREREQIIRSNLTPAEQYAERMERLGRIVEFFQDSPDALSAIEINREALAAAEDYERALGRVTDQQQNMVSAAQDFSRAIGTAFEDAILGGKRWQDVLRGILSDIGRIILRMTITSPLQSGLQSLLGSALGGITGARAMGGPVSPGSSYRVGEFGPERFVPNVPGRIEPAGGGVTVNLSIGVGVAQTVQAEIRNLLPVITRSVQAAVADRAQRGGGYAAALRG